MKILVIGSGGREHAILEKLVASPNCEKLYCAPGNGGTAKVAENVPISVDEIEKLADFAQENEIDLTVVGPEAPLAAGITDVFKEKGLKIFGPNRHCAQLESSKAFTKEFLKRHAIPTADYQECNSYDEAEKALENFSFPMVIKADGLCAGKGVYICENRESAEDALKEIMLEGRFGEEGNKVVLEEFLDGFEASVFCFVSKGKLFPMVSAKDYKKIGEGDVGPNTGGVGAFCPNILLSDEDNKKIYDEIVPMIEEGLLKDNLCFDGILFIGFMIDKVGPKILEFNVRFGDPETQVVLQRLDSDLLMLMDKAIQGNLGKEDFQYNTLQWMTVILTSKGYPGEYEKVKSITLSGIMDEEVLILHNGTLIKDNNLYTNGGRVLSVCAGGKDLEDCRKKIYKAIEKIHFDGMTYRKDIGMI